jgi:hypothetical protein
MQYLQRTTLLSWGFVLLLFFPLALLAQSNVALQKQTSQSSDYSRSSGQSFKAVDGNTSGAWNMGSITHTRGGNGESNPWWQVDLGNTYEINSIRIWNRTDCCSERLTNLNIWVKADEPNAMWMQYNARTHQYSARGGNPLVFNGNAMGRYVKVQLESNQGILSLAEVEVFGTQILESVDAQFVRATSTGSGIGCNNGTIWDPIDGGTCWTCPDGYNRTTFSVKSDKACERPASERFAKAIRHGKGKGILGTDCDGGQFWDPNGYCYSCPSGYNRTAHPVTSAKACSQRVHAEYTTARKYADAKKCEDGSFFDVGTNKCWTCPEGYRRTVFPVTGGKACELIR